MDNEPTIGKLTQNSQPVRSARSSTALNSETTPISGGLDGTSGWLSELHSCIQGLEIKLQPVLMDTPPLPPSDPIDTSGTSDHAVKIATHNSIIKGLTDYVRDIQNRVEV